jgi:hypothetical protein
MFSGCGQMRYVTEILGLEQIHWRDLCGKRKWVEIESNGRVLHYSSEPSDSIKAENFRIS